MIIPNVETSLAFLRDPDVSLRRITSFGTPIKMPDYTDYLV